MKFKFHLLILILLIIFLGLFTYSFFSNKGLYRNDCGKTIDGYDILFVYITTCPHCKADLLRLEELNLTDKIYMINAESPLCKKIIEDFSENIIYHKNSNSPNIPFGIYTPTKVCIYNGKTFIGEQNKEDLKKFFEDCQGAKI
ncbi:MAG: hypothetical protein QXQ18_01625 [Candidatus Aenigmatarchaeota archaeon]